MNVGSVIIDVDDFFRSFRIPDPGFIFDSVKADGYDHSRGIEQDGQLGYDRFEL